MTRIEIVTKLMAAAVSSNMWGPTYMDGSDIEACERLADGIIAYDEAHKNEEDEA